MPRIHYRGTNASDSIGPVALTQIDDDESWTLTWAQKKQLYGVQGLIAVGGRGDVVDDGPDKGDDAEDAVPAAASGVPLQHFCWRARECMSGLGRPPSSQYTDRSRCTRALARGT